MLRWNILSNSRRALPHRRFFTTPPHSTPKSAPSTPGASSINTSGRWKSAEERVRRINARLPRFLHRYTARLVDWPVSHVTSFLVLHEITAIVPLLGLAFLFHRRNWLPVYFSEGRWVNEGIEKAERYFRRKGWLPAAEGQAAEDANCGSDAKVNDPENKAEHYEGRGGTYRIVAELGTAYAVTKALLPLRILVSVWATPWFARWIVIPAVGGFKRILRS